MLFITARVPASTKVAPLFQQNCPSAVASTPIHTNTAHWSVVVGSFSGLPNSSQAGSTISSAPMKK